MENYRVTGIMQGLFRGYIGMEATITDLGFRVHPHGMAIAEAKQGLMNECSPFLE